MFIVYRGTSILMAPFLFISAILRSAKIGTLRISKLKTKKLKADLLESAVVILFFPHEVTLYW